MLSLAEGALCVSAVPLVGGTLGYLMAGVRVRVLRNSLALAVVGSLLVAPFLLPQDSSIGRGALATVVLLAVHRLWETARNVYPVQAHLSFYSYLCYFLFVPEIQFSGTPEQRSAAQREGIWRLLRGLLHAVALALAFTAVAYWPQILEHWVSRTLWNLVAMYTFCAASCDLVGGCGMLATGHGALEVFRWPFLSASPREFWGRRWNMTFHNAAHRLIFEPIAPRNPLLASVWVFTWSAAVHEYVVVAALGRTYLHMTAFFLVQGAATVLQTQLRHKKRLKPLLRPWAILLHTVWFGATSSLFFAPVTAILEPSQLLQMPPFNALVGYLLG